MQRISITVAKRYHLTTSIPRYFDTSIPRYFDTSIPRYFDTSIPRYLDTSIPRYLDTSIPRYFDTSILRYFDTSILLCHHYHVSRGCCVTLSRAKRQRHALEIFVIYALCTTIRSDTTHSSLMAVYWPRCLRVALYARGRCFDMA